MPRLTSDEISRRVTYHPPSEAAIKRHETTRAEIARTMDTFNTILPETREKSLVMTKLEEAMFWANACIARNHDEFV